MSNITDWAAIAQKLHQDCRALESKLVEVTKQRDELAKSLELVWNHLKGERIRHAYIFGTGKAGDLKTLQQVCTEALAAKKGGEG